MEDEARNLVDCVESNLGCDRDRRNPVDEEKGLLSSAESTTAMLKAFFLFSHLVKGRIRRGAMRCDAADNAILRRAYS